MFLQYSVQQKEVTEEKEVKSFFTSSDVGIANVTPFQAPPSHTPIKQGKLLYCRFCHQRSNRKKETTQVLISEPSVESSDSPISITSTTEGIVKKEKKPKQQRHRDKQKTEKLSKKSEMGTHAASKSQGKRRKSDADSHKKFIKEIFKGKAVTKEEPIKTKEALKEEPIKSKEALKEPIKTKEVPKEETSKTKEALKEETIKTKEVPKEEPIKTKEVPKEELQIQTFVQDRSKSPSIKPLNSDNVSQKPTTTQHTREG
jgi:hypothetical protein